MYLTTFDQFRSGAALPVDGIRRENDVLLRFDVPGIDPESIEVTVARGWLTVSGKREAETTDGERFFVRERPTGSFTRRVRLSDRLDASAIEASHRNGVLEVRVPVAEEAKPRKVEIQTANASELAA
jgi:HSP20 family protein